MYLCVRPRVAVLLQEVLVELHDVNIQVLDS